MEVVWARPNIVPERSIRKTMSLGGEVPSMYLIEKMYQFPETLLFLDMINGILPALIPTVKIFPLSTV